MRQGKLDKIDILNGKVLRLCEMMETETEMCTDLLELSKSEQHYLMKNKIDILLENTKKMKGAVIRLKELQKIRRKFMEEVGSLLAIDSEDVSVINITDSLYGDLKTKLLQCRKKLVKAGDRLYESNHNTVYLVNFSLDLLEQQSELWKELASADEEGYTDSSGKENKKAYAVAVEEKA
ncbi:flagellar export chaperone FlgN [bacterium]|nr:flagellar export chaperone FlgN [bacterium]